MYGMADDYLVNYLGITGTEVSVFSDFGSEHAQRSCMPLWLHPRWGVSRAGALANSQAATISLGSCCRSGFACSLLLEEVLYRKRFSQNVGAYHLDSLPQHRHVFRGHTCITDKEHFTPWRGAINQDFTEGQTCLFVFKIFGKILEDLFSLSF